MLRAFRRPATDEEVDWAARYYVKVRPTTSSFEAALREVLRAGPGVAQVSLSARAPIRSSRVKQGSADRLGLASRLSYFLWATMPDQELIELARRGKLKEDAMLAKQVERMLAIAARGNSSEALQDNGSIWTESIQ